MAEKKKLQQVMKRLTLFEAWENNKLERILDTQDRESFNDAQWTIMEKISDKQGREDYGFWSSLYLAYLDLKYTLQPEELKGEHFDRFRYANYEKALTTRSPVPSHLETKDYLEREALLIYTADERERGRSLNDEFNMMLFIEDWGEELRYCAPWKKWLLWDESRWGTDERNRVLEMALQTLRKGLSRATDYCRNAEETMAMVAHLKRSLSNNKVESLLKLCRGCSSTSVLPEEMDQAPYLFNCANGILELHSGRLMPHDRSLLMTKISPVPYKEKADCSRWKRFLKDVFDGNRELIKFVQKFAGCCLTGDVSCQAMFILYGNGANGKSTFINIINKILGDYAKTTPTETFMERRGNEASNDIACLKGSRLVTATESDQKGRLAEPTIKRLTGNDVISARFLYGEYFSFVPTFKIVMATNHKPRISGMDLAIWRRIKLIPFEVSFPEDKQDKLLTDKLEAELPGILHWMVEGCLKWQKEGLGHVSAIAEAVDEYRNEMSDIQMFLTERCERDELSMIQGAEFYQAYVNWCEANNERPRNNRNFGMLLAEAGLDKARRASGNIWLGVRLMKFGAQNGREDYNSSS